MQTIAQQHAYSYIRFAGAAQAVRGLFSTPDGAMPPEKHGYAYAKR
jgi:hypothetical protein